MAAADPRFYLDEHLDVEIARQLKRLGIDVITVRDLSSFGESDLMQLQSATQMGRVFCTNDSDLIEIASGGVEHTGTVIGQQEKHVIGTWVKHLKKMVDEYRADELINHVEYVSTVD